MTRREYKELYLHHYSRAEKGNIESLLKLGEFYEYGKGVVQDYKLAEFWYAKAAEKKHPMATLNLSWLRLKQDGSTLHVPIFHRR